jgi:lipopolysaccharide transport system ATP-binding protein
MTRHGSQVLAEQNDSKKLATVELTSDVPASQRYAIDLVQVSKQFRRLHRGSGYSTFKSFLLSGFRSQRSQATVSASVLSNITLRIPQGASVGIIGRNGSGKSTLLKIITGIYLPDSGRVSVGGRIAALIELGAGFHPDFTGRENLMLGGIMHGLTRDEIEERFDEIVRFAELEHVIDEPVRTYSSGMFMRLGFSLAVHTSPQVLLVDEVLAVGDASFVAKCKDKLAELKRSGTTLLLVSHDLDAVARWCDEVLWLEGGAVRDRGDPRRVIDHYHQFLEARENQERLAALEQTQAVEDAGDFGSLHDEATHKAAVEDVGPGEAREGAARWGSKEIEIVGIDVCQPGVAPQQVFALEDAIQMRIRYAIREKVDAPVFGVAIHRNDGTLIFGSNTDIDRVALSPEYRDALVGDVGVLECTFPRLGLAEGVYVVDVAVHASDGYPYDYRKGVGGFTIRSSSKEVGIVSPVRVWGQYIQRTQQ